MSLPQSPSVTFFCPVANFKGGAENSLFDLMATPSITPSLIVPAEGPVEAEARRRGIPVRVLPINGIGNIRRPVRVSSLLGAMGETWAVAMRLRALLRQSGSAVLHTNGLKAHLLGIAGTVFSQTKLVIHVRDIPHTRVEKLIWRLMAFSADALLLISPSCWPGEGPLPANATLVPNGISLPGKMPVHKPAANLRVGYVGRLTPWKGVEDLLEWFAEARQNGFKGTLDIRGEEGPENPGYTKELKDKAKALGLGRSCVFRGKVTGPMSGVYGNLDVLAVPSREEPFGRIVMEAMSLGIPVVARPVGGIPSMVLHGETGFHVTDGASFRKALGKLETGKTYQTMAQKAFAHINGGFSLNALHANIGRVYRNIQA